MIIPSWVYAIIAAVLMTASGAAGWKASAWRSDAAHAQTISKLEKSIGDLKLAIAEANQALAVAAEQSKAAEAVSLEAQGKAALLERLSQSRVEKLTSALSASATCGEVLSRYWEIRK